MDASIKSDSGHMMDTFCEDWVTHLDWKERPWSLSLQSVLGKGETEAPELAAIVTGKSDRTIWE